MEGNFVEVSHEIEYRNPSTFAYFFTEKENY